MSHSDLGMRPASLELQVTYRLLHTWLALSSLIVHRLPFSLIIAIISFFYILNREHCPPWRRQWYPTPVLLPGKSHGWRSLVGCSPWGREESDTTERLPFHFHALEKEMATHSSVLAWRIQGWEAWWAAVYGVAQSWTRLKRLSSSSRRLS